MSLSSTLKALAAAGGTVEQLIAVVEAHERRMKGDVEAWNALGRAA